MNWKSEKKERRHKTIYLFELFKVCMLNTFDTYGILFNKYTASYGAICVTLIKITF